MTPEPEIVDAALRRIEADSKHPTRKLAAEAIAKFTLDRERQGQPLPIATAHDVHGAPLLDVREVEARARPNHAPKVEVKRRKRSLLFWR